MSRRLSVISDRAATPSPHRLAGFNHIVSRSIVGKHRGPALNLRLRDGFRGKSIPKEDVITCLPRRIRRIVLASLTIAAAWLGVARADAPVVPTWTADQTSQLEAALATAGRHGLNAEAYLRAAADGTDESRTRTALAYARALWSGVVDPREVHAIYALERPHMDLRAGLSVALAAGRVGPWLDSLSPQDTAYMALSRAYLAALSEAAASPNRNAIPAGPPIGPGHQDPRIPAISARLAERGFVVPAAPAALGPDLVTAVRGFQAASGLTVDGIVGPDTLEALNEGPQERARRLAVNLERRRWLARRPPAERIDVNTATARVAYMRGGDVVWRGRAVTGAPAHTTPWMAAQVETLVVNPPWVVPTGIAARELLPQGAAYLKARHIRLTAGRLVQAPGPDSALGLVKFDMPSPYAIYLHDTPAKALFEEAERHRSHGCVRVENAVALAGRIAASRGQESAFQAALASGETRTVALGTPLPVRLLYLTATTNAAGDVRLAPDIYGWDARLADRLGLEGPRLRARLRPQADLLGP